jgi:hypothetical protein
MRVMLYGMLRLERRHIGVAWPWFGLGDPEVSSVLRLPKRLVETLLAIGIGIAAIGAAEMEYADMTALSRSPRPSLALRAEASCPTAPAAPCPN